MCIFARSNTGIVSLNPTRGMDVDLHFFFYDCTVTRSGLRVSYRQVLDWMIGLTPYRYIQLRSTRSYRAITDLHNLQFTVRHKIGLSVLISRILATDL
jgi:hypothetical protein